MTQPDLEWLHKLLAEVLAYDDKIEALIKERDEARAAIERVRAVIEQGYPKPASKHDVCEHDLFGSENCIACYDIALVQALSIGGEG